MSRVYNFSAGPSCLPEEVLKSPQTTPIKRVDETNNSEMSKLTGSVGLPGLF